MPRRPMLIVALAALLTASLARAAEREATLAGSHLVIDSPCARAVDIQPDPSLHDKVAVSASADHDEELDHLLLEGGAAVRLHTKPGNCWRPTPFGSWLPTARMTVRVPPGFAVAIDESSIASYTLGGVGGSLALELSGVGEVTAQTATELKLDLSGTGHVRVADVTGPVRMELSGAGNVSIGRVHAPSLVVDLSGAGTLAIDAGDIGQATVGSSGFGTIRIGAVLGGAHVDLSGMGSVHLARVTGQLEKEVSGLGSVTVGQ